jgi:hypothetical protein
MTRIERLTVPRITYYTSRQETRVELMRRLLNPPPVPEPRPFDLWNRMREAASRMFPRTNERRVPVTG